MARNLSAIYPGKITVDGSNPDGTFKNEVTPGVSGDGTPLEQQWQQDVWGWMAHFLNKVGVSPNGVQENEATSQIYDAIETAVRNLFPLYDATNTYIKGALTIGSDDVLYKSLIAANLNNDPTSSPSEWMDIASLATTTVAGLVEKSTSAENIAGTDDTVFPSVAGAREVTRNTEATVTLKGSIERATTAENIAGASDIVYPTALGIREAFNAAGSAPVFACRAWVNFTGTGGGGTRTINGSGNVSSVTDVSGGQYTINFTTALEDANYSFAWGATFNNRGGNVRTIITSLADAVPTTTTLNIDSNRPDTNSNVDPDNVYIAVFR